MNLKPITLVFGANSAGKSSLIHSLLLAHEGLVQGDFNPSYTSLGGESVDLGGFANYVHRHDSEQEIIYTFESEVHEPFYNVRFENRINARRRRYRLVNPTKLRFTLYVGAAPHIRKMPDFIPSVSRLEIEADGIPLYVLDKRKADNDNKRWAEFEDALFISSINFDHPVMAALYRCYVERYFAPVFQEREIVQELSTILKQFDISPRALTIDSPESHPAVHEPIFVLFGTRIQGSEGKLFQRTYQNSGAEGLEDLIDYIQEGKATSLKRLTSDFPVTKEVLTDIKRKIGGKTHLDENIVLSRLRMIADNGPRAAQGFFEYITELLKSVSDVLFGDLNALTYLGPLRAYPDRIPKREHTQDSNWRALGGYAWHAVQENAELRTKVNQWLGSDFLKTVYRLETRKLYAEQDVQQAWEAGTMVLTSGNILTSVRATATDLSLLDLRTGTRVTHRDIGVGVSQILPVLVSAYGSAHKTIMIEQPEIHLHPALQAELGDVFIKTALGEQKNQYILETHSEHLILRLMRRIRETSSESLPDGLPPVTPDDVAILFVEATNQGSIVRQIHIDDDGQLLDAWPGGFFEEGFRERFS